MSKIRFNIGFVQISLPSKMTGDGDTFVGKAKVHLYSLSCSHAIWIWRGDLERFFDQVDKAYRTLKGKFALGSQRGGFSLSGEMTAKGHAKIDVKIGDPLKHHPDYNEWYAECSFKCGPDALRSVLEARSSLTTL